MTHRALPLLRLAILYMAFTLGSCGGPSEPDEPIPGQVRIVLFTTDVDLGALLINIEGPSPRELAGVGELIVEWMPLGLNQSRVAVFGALAAGELLTMSVPDTRPQALAAYRFSVVESAARTFAIRNPLSSYVSGLFVVTP